MKNYLFLFTIFIFNNVLAQNLNNVPTNINFDYYVPKWSKQNLDSDKFIDGSKIKVFSDIKEFVQYNLPACFIDLKSKGYFYNYDAITYDIDIPLGYRIPNREDFKRLLKDSINLKLLCERNSKDYVDFELNMGYILDPSFSEFKLSKNGYSNYWTKDEYLNSMAWYVKLSYKDLQIPDTTIIDYSSVYSGFPIRCIEDMNEIMLIRQDFDYFKLKPTGDTLVRYLKQTLEINSQDLLLSKLNHGKLHFNKRDSIQYLSFKGQIRFNNKGQNTSKSFTKFQNDNQLYPYKLISALNYSLKKYEYYPKYNYKPIGSYSDFVVNLSIKKVNKFKKLDSIVNWNSASISNDFINKYNNAKFDLYVSTIGINIPELGNGGIKDYKIVDHVKLGSAWNSLLSVVPGWGWSSVNKNKELRKYANFSLGLMATGIASYIYSRYEYQNYQNKNYEGTIYSRANLSNKVFLVATSIYVPLVVYDFTRTFIRGKKLQKSEKKINNIIDNLPNSIVYN